MMDRSSARNVRVPRNRECTHVATSSHSFNKTAHTPALHNLGALYAIN